MLLGLSATAWMALGCLVGIVLISGVLLWAAWRRGIQPRAVSQESARKPGPSPTRAWTREEDQLEELSQRVDALREQDQEREQKSK